METTNKRLLDAIAARAIHDPRMREILNEFGLYQSDASELRDAMEELPASRRDDLIDASEELEEASGLSNDAYQTLGDFAHRRWVDLMRDNNEQAKSIMQDMEPALQAVQSQNAEKYEHYQTRFAEHGQIMTEAVAEARNDLRRDIRRAIKDMGFDLDTQTRAPLVDHLTRSAPVPTAVSDVMGASNKLEAAKSRHDLDVEQRRHLGPQATPNARLGM